MFRPIREVVIPSGGGGGEGQSIQRIIIMTIHNLKKNVNILNYHSIIMQRPRIIWNFPFYKKKDEKSSPGYFINCMLGD